jgi:O-antigen/teichoic acid export membrane protein
LWKYSGFLQLNQLVDFVHMQADQWIVLYCLKDPTDPSGARSLAILGGYNLARSLARFVGVVPIALRGIVFSTLCQFQDESQIERSRRTFRLSVLIDNLVSFPVALLMMCFAREIVGFMSGKYPPVVAQVLLLVAGMAAVTNLAGASAVYVMGRGGSRFTFIVTAIGAAAQVALTWLLLSLGGRELSVAVARTAGLMVMLVLTAGWMLRNLPRAIPAAWIVSAVVLVVTAVAVFYGEPRLLWRVGLFAAGTAVVMAANLRQMDAVIRRLVLSPWRMLRLVVEEQKMPSNGRT